MNRKQDFELSLIFRPSWPYNQIYNPSFEEKPLLKYQQLIYLYYQQFQCVFHQPDLRMKTDLTIGVMYLCVLIYLRCDYLHESLAEKRCLPLLQQYKCTVSFAIQKTKTFQILFLKEYHQHETE